SREMHRAIARRGVPRPILVALAEPQELLHRHRLGGDGETPAYPPAALEFIIRAKIQRSIIPVFFRGRRSHHEFHRTGDHHHRLTLSVDVPLALRRDGISGGYPARHLIADAFEAFFRLLLVLPPCLVGLTQPFFLLP